MALVHHHQSDHKSGHGLMPGIASAGRFLCTKFPEADSGVSKISNRCGVRFSWSKHSVLLPTKLSIFTFATYETHHHLNSQS